MKKLNAHLLVLSVLLFTGTNLSSCKKHENIVPPCIIVDATTDPSTPVVDSQQAILGKWASTKSDTDLTLLYPNSYEEFLPDSAKITYNYPDNAFYQSVYWLSDSILYISSKYITSEDSILIVKQPFRYKFLDYNKLQLDNIYPSWVSTYFYKRIECANQK